MPCTADLLAMPLDRPSSRHGSFRPHGQAAHLEPKVVTDHPFSYGIQSEILHAYMTQYRLFYFVFYFTSFCTHLWRWPSISLDSPNNHESYIDRAREGDYPGRMEGNMKLKKMNPNEVYRKAQGVERRYADMDREINSHELVP